MQRTSLIWKVSMVLALVWSIVGCGSGSTKTGGAPAFTVHVAPGSNAVTAGQSSVYTVTVNAENGFSTPVDLAVSGLPNGATAAFSPASVTPTAQGVTSSLTVHTTVGTPVGTVTLAVTGTGGGKTNHASATLVVNASGSGGDGLPNILVADASNGRIAGFEDMTGAGWKTLTIPGILYFGDVAVDSQGRIYMTDRDGSRIIRVDHLDGSGQVTFGSPGSGVNQFSGVQHIFVDGLGRIYIGDDGNNRIVRIDDMTGAGWVAFNGSSTIHVSGVASDIFVAGNGQIYFADGFHHLVRMNDMTGAGLVILGSNGTGVGHFNDPTGICTDSSGRIYVADGDRIARMDDMTGAGWVTYGVHAENGPEVGKFSITGAIALDAQNRIYITDAGHLVRIDDMTGAGWTTFGSFGDAVGQFGFAFGLAVKH